MSEPAKDEAELINLVAVATCLCGGKCYVFDGATWCSSRGKESVAATIRAIRAAGWVVVPVEPTDEMRSAVNRADWSSDTDLHWSDGYRIMIAAAPGVKP